MLRFGLPRKNLACRVRVWLAMQRYPSHYLAAFGQELERLFARSIRYILITLHPPKLIIPSKGTLGSALRGDCEPVSFDMTLDRDCAGGGLLRREHAGRVPSLLLLLLLMYVPAAAVGVAAVAVDVARARDRR